MLANYDAEAIAEVMGIAFLRDKEAGTAMPTTSPKVAKRRRPATGAAIGTCTFFVDRDALRIVDTRPNDRAVRHRLVKLARLPQASSETAGDSRIRPPTAALIEIAVEQGLPRRAFRLVADRLAGNDRGRIASLEWSVVPRTTLERRTQQLSPQESERTERVARLFVHARRSLGSEAEAREFMTTPHPLLGGRSPIDAARTDLGTRRTEQILNALEYGLAL